MPGTTQLNSGDVVLVEFVFSEGIGKKKRPALVISNERYHRRRQEVIITAITSNIRRILAGDTKISDWKSAKLLAPSVVTGIIQTVKKHMIIRKLGKLESTDYQATKEWHFLKGFL